MVEISVVIPVYQGETTLPDLVAELALLTTEARTPAGHAFRVAEVLLVHDAAIDRSDEVIKTLAGRHAWVRPIWLSRNFGQHPATLAGMASSSCAWVVTMDEDGLHRPAHIGALLDRALESAAQLVYAVQPRGAHGLFRDTASALVKRSAGRLIGLRPTVRFSSFRLIEGEIARGISSYCGSGVYLDVALSWVVQGVVGCVIPGGRDDRRRSGYTFPKLVAHLWRLLLTSGTRPLRMVTAFGVASLALALVGSAFAVWQKLAHRVPVQGWTSTFIAMAFFSGWTLFTLGVLAEYLGATLTAAMGKPLYLIVSRPVRARGQLP